MDQWIRLVLKQEGSGQFFDYDALPDQVESAVLDCDTDDEIREMTKENEFRNGEMRINTVKLELASTLQQLNQRERSSCIATD